MAISQLKKIRAFLGIPIPNELKNSLNIYLEKIKVQVCPEDIHWTKTENLHLTLYFLGSVYPEALNELSIEIKTKLLPFQAFRLELLNFNFFPKHHPRMIAIFLKPNELLLNLNEKLKDLIVGKSFRHENKAFIPHITVGRFIHTKLPAIDFSQCRINKNFLVKHFYLYESLQTLNGSQYEALERF